MKYTVYRTKRRTIRLVLRNDVTLAVYCPKKCSKQFIDETVSKHYAELKAKHDLRSQTLFGQDGSSLPLFGNRHHIIYNNVKKFSFDGEHFISPSTDKAEIRAMYKEFLRVQTKKAVLPIVTEIANQHGFRYGKLCIRASYSRFGSCSEKNNLNFSLALAAFPIDFIRFVVSHELCHTVHFNHSKNFYALLDKVCPENKSIKSSGAKQRSEILKSIFFNPAF